MYGTSRGIDVHASMQNGRCCASVRTSAAIAMSPDVHIHITGLIANDHSSVALVMGWARRAWVWGCLAALRIVKRLNDVTALVSLNATLRRLNWNPPAFFTDGAAASPTLQHTLLKSLLLTTPDSILELGSGQSTKLLSLYRGDYRECYVLTLEESEAWAGQMSKLISHDYRFSPVTTKQIQLSGRSVLMVAGPTHRWIDHFS